MYPLVLMLLYLVILPKTATVLVGCGIAIIGMSDFIDITFLIKAITNCI